VKALEWVVRFTKRYDPKMLSGAGGASGLEPFLTGKAALCTAVPNYAIALMKQQKLSFKYGIASQQTYPAGGAKGVSWESGHTFAIPTGRMKPKQAWEFAPWLCASYEGSMAYCTLGSARLTGYREAPILKRLAGHSELGDATVEVLEGARYHRPVSPATNLLMKELEPAGLAAATGKKTAKQALDEAQVKVMKELARDAKW
jgi:multiple sugar transport system substrate-binding protein